MERKRIINRGKALVFLLTLCSTLPAAGLTLVYIETTDSYTVEHIIRIEQTPEGYSILMTSRGVGVPMITQSLMTDRQYSVLSWSFSDREGETEISGVREGSLISLSGRYRGKAMERSFKVDDKPWYQLFPHGLEHLVVSGQQELLFYAAGFEGAGAMRIGTFRARRGEVEEIELHGRLIPAVHVRISLTGFASVLWSGDYWYRRGDGRNLVSRSNRGPGSQDLVIELFSEN